MSAGMFDNFKDAKTRKAPPWAGPVLGGAVIFHIVLFVSMWVKTIWDIEQLERPKTTIDLAVAPPPPPPPTPLEGSRIAGEKMISPDDVTKTEIQRSGKDRVIGSFKLCLTIGGDISNVNMLKSTGFPAYDNKILSTIRGTWRYKPYNVNG